MRHIDIITKESMVEKVNANDVNSIRSGPLDRYGLAGCKAEINGWSIAPLDRALGSVSK